MMWGGFGGGWMMFMGALTMLIFWGTLIVLAVWGIRALSGGSNGQVGAPPDRDAANAALEILRARYARGEIAADQYEEMRRVLDG